MEYKGEGMPERLNIDIAPPKADGLGRFMRKWQEKPFDNGTEYVRSDLVKDMHDALVSAYWFINASEIELEEIGRSRVDFLKDFHKKCPQLPTQQSIKE